MPHARESYSCGSYTGKSGIQLKSSLLCVINVSLCTSAVAAIASPREALRLSRINDEVAAIYQLEGQDVKAANTFEQPDAITPYAVTDARLDGNKLTLTLPPLSFTVISTK